MERRAEASRLAEEEARATAAQDEEQHEALSVPVVQEVAPAEEKPDVVEEEIPIEPQEAPADEVAEVPEEEEEEVEVPQEVPVGELQRRWSQVTESQIDDEMLQEIQAEILQAQADMFDAQQMVAQIKSDHRRTVKAMHKELEKNKHEASKILEVPCGEMVAFCVTIFIGSQ